MKYQTTEMFWGTLAILPSGNKIEFCCKDKSQIGEVDMLIEGSDFVVFGMKNAQLRLVVDGVLQSEMIAPRVCT